MPKSIKVVLQEQEEDGMMSKKHRITVTQVLLVLSFVLVATKSLALSCKFEELTIRNPAEGVSQVHYTFSQPATTTRSGRTYEVVNLTERLDIDVTHIRSEFVNRVNSQIPKSTFSDRYNAHNHRIELQSDGSLLGTAFITYERWIKKDLLIDELKTRVFRKTVKLNTTLKPYVDSKNTWKVRIASHVDFRESFLENFIDNLTLGLLKIPESIQNKIEQRIPKIPTTDILMGFKEDREAIKMRFEKARFVSGGTGRLYAQLTSASQIKSGTACKFFEKLKARQPERGNDCKHAQTTFGGNGGSPFPPVVPLKLSMRTGAYVDAIILNGQRHGGNGGSPTGVLQLGDGEYVNRVVIRHGAFVDRLEFYTNLGQSLHGGGQGGSLSSLNNVRVLKIGGRNGRYLDQIEVIYCADYQ